MTRKGYRIVLYQPLVFCILLITSISSLAQNSLSWEEDVRALETLEEQLFKIRDLPLEQYSTKDLFIVPYLDSINSTEIIVGSKIEALLISIKTNKLFAAGKYDEYIIQVDTIKDSYSDFPLIQAGFYQGISNAYNKIGDYLY
jgi:hypothetical protein